MKRPSRQDDGLYHVNGKTYKTLIGSRQQVFNGTCYKTSGELTNHDLMMNKWGRIVSKKKHATAKKEKRLQKHGFFAKKGKFGFVRKSVRGSRSRRNKTMKKRGGDDTPVQAMPSEEVVHVAV
jgi:hypothetical protein